MSESVHDSGRKTRVIEEVWPNPRDDIFALYRDKDRVYKVIVPAFARVIETWKDSNRSEEKILPLVMVRGGKLVPPYDRGGSLWVGMRIGADLILFDVLENVGERDTLAEEALKNAQRPEREPEVYQRRR